MREQRHRAIQVFAGAALILAAMIALSACAASSGDDGNASGLAPAAMNVDGSSAFCVDLASRIKSLESAGVPQKLAQSSRTKVPLSGPDQVAAHDYLSATETHMFKCGLAGGAGLTKAP